MTTTDTFAPPAHLMKGSDAWTLVNRMLEFLDTWGQTHELDDLGIVQDGKLGEVGLGALVRYQRIKKIPITGDCDMDTRAKMLEDGFDFNAAAQEETELSMFTQPDGSVLYWMPGMEPTPDLSIASSAARRLRHGN